MTGPSAVEGPLFGVIVIGRSCYGAAISLPTGASKKSLAFRQCGGELPVLVGRISSQILL